MTKKEQKFLKDLGKQIKALRIERGWTLEDTEYYGNPSWRHLQQIENGKKNITILTLRRVSKLYDLKIEDLLIHVPD